MSKTILQYMNYAAAYKGNFMESLEYLEEELREKGFTVIYAVISAQAVTSPPDWIHQMIDGGKRVIILPNEGKKDTAILKQLMREEPVCLIHTHFITMKQYVNLYKAVFAQSVPVIMHMHNHSQEMKNPIKAWIRRCLYNRCTMVACGPSVYKSLERDYPGIKKCTIDNCVKFQRLDEYEHLENDVYGLQGEEIVCLIFGADFYRKGVDRALKSLKELQNEGHSCALLISVSKDLENTGIKVKEVLGELPDWVKIIPARSDVASLYNKATIFLSPSREEGLPYSVIEAAYCRCMVVLSNIPPQKGLKIDYGYWFEEEDTEGFKEQILKAAEEYPLKEQGWKQAQERVKEAYALPVWREKMSNLYLRLLEGERDIG